VKSSSIDFDALARGTENSYGRRAYHHYKERAVYRPHDEEMQLATAVQEIRRRLTWWRAIF